MTAIGRKAAAIQAVRMSAPSFFGVERSFYYNEKSIRLLSEPRWLKDRKVYGNMADGRAR